ncbi:MAG: hypothetical protein ACP5HK_02515 [Acidilobus sp.]
MASDQPDLAELASDLDAIANSLSGLCEYVGGDVLNIVDRLASCMDSHNVACAVDLVSRLREQLKALSRTISVLTGLRVQRALTGLGLLTISMFMMLAPTSALDLEVAPIGVGLGIAALVLYVNKWSALVALFGSAILVPVTIFDGQPLFTLAMSMLLASSAGSLIIELKARSVSNGIVTFMSEGRGKVGGAAGGI